MDKSLTMMKLVFQFVKMEAISAKKEGVGIVMTKDNAKDFVLRIHKI